MSLNRTMQYGNYAKYNLKVSQENGLNRTMQYGNFHELCKRPNGTKVFKSYYVVWKPLASVNASTFARGLNRTMQYGNSSKWKKIANSQYSLNRTMQYGNLLLLFPAW